MKQEDILEEEQYLPEAENGVRIANFVIDTIINYIIIFVLSALIALIMFSVSEEFATEVFVTDVDNPVVTLISYVLAFSVTFLYYFISETTSQRTIGKFVTGTIVVTESGEKPTTKQIAIRSASRLVPFDPISFFGHGWHDKWSDTYVVKKKDLNLTDF